MPEAAISDSTLRQAARVYADALPRRLIAAVLVARGADRKATCRALGVARVAASEVVFAATWAAWERGESTELPSFAQRPRGAAAILDAAHVLECTTGRLVIPAVARRALEATIGPHRRSITWLAFPQQSTLSSSHADI